MEIRRLKLDIEPHERQISRLTRPSRVDDIIRKYRHWVERLRETPTDREATVALRPIIRRVTFDAVWIEQEGIWRRGARVDLDYEKLLKLADR